MKSGNPRGNGLVKTLAVSDIRRNISGKEREYRVQIRYFVLPLSHENLVT